MNKAGDGSQDSRRYPNSNSTFVSSREQVERVELTSQLGRISAPSRRREVGERSTGRPVARTNGSDEGDGGRHLDSGRDKGNCLDPCV
jgi:hypothetical protein